MDLKTQVLEDIAKTKKALVRKWKRYGPHERFGQKEVRKLEDKYAQDLYTDGIWSLIMDLGDWCMNYTGE